MHTKTLEEAEMKATVSLLSTFVNNCILWVALMCGCFGAVTGQVCTPGDLRI